MTRTQMTAIQQLELWKVYAVHWCEHKPSVTISVKEDEWMDVGAWVYDNFEIASGVSFLPHSDHTYQQAPYQDIEADDYVEWQLERGGIHIDWDVLSEYEKEDNTTGSRELACTAGVCEVVRSKCSVRISPKNPLPIFAPSAFPDAFCDDVMAHLPEIDAMTGDGEGAVNKSIRRSKLGG